MCGRWQMTCFLCKPEDFTDSDMSMSIISESSAREEQIEEMIGIKTLRGSFESLMMGEAEDWNGFKMMDIHEFMKLYDPTYITEDDYVKTRLSTVKYKMDPKDTAASAKVKMNW